MAAACYHLDLATAQAAQNFALLAALESKLEAGVGVHDGTAAAAAESQNVVQQMMMGLLSGEFEAP